MRKLHSAFRILSGGIFLALAAGGGAQANPWKAFDVTGSTSVTPTAYTANNTIFGYYGNPDSTYSSFIRTSDGTVTTFNLADAGSTKASSANSSGDIAGTVFANGGSQAFLRTADGQSTVFSVGGATFTEATGVAGNDWVAGDYIDPVTSKTVGYVHRPGKVETFAAPDGSSITVKAINNDDTVIGSYGTVGYIRDIHGNIASYAISGAANTVPIAINNNGLVAGDYIDTSGLSHIFFRQSNGRLGTINSSSCTNGTFVTGVNDSAIIVGWCRNSQNFIHGFAFDLTIAKGVSLNAPKGVNGTQILAVDKTGKLVGVYYDADNVAHPVRANQGVTGF